MEKPEMPLSAQLRAARALLGLSPDEIAVAAGVDAAIIAVAERDCAAAATEAVRALVAALEEAGVVFLDSGESEIGGPGVRLRDGDAEVSMRPDELNAANDD